MYSSRADVDPVTSTLQACLLRNGLTGARAYWTAMPGGRTNRVWHIGTDGADLICKLFLPGRGTPLFPNSHLDETTALVALAHSGVAPDHLATLDTCVGPCVVYAACEGPSWTKGARQVGALLRRLHVLPSPVGLRRVAIAPGSILRTADAIMRQIPEIPALSRRRPATTAIPDAAASFLHGDPVPGNIVMTPRGAVLIDWQCPAWGDPIHDIALFLSPAMQVLDLGAPLDATERAAFWCGYGDSGVQTRFARAEPALSWRMAVYCAWRMHHGHLDYEPALAAELDRLDHLSQ